MEYFAKFTRHIGTPRRAAGGGTSQLGRFEKAWKTVQSICYYQSKWRGMRVEKTPLGEELKAMVDLLVQEDIQQAGSDDWTTGVCMEYLLGNGVLEALVGLAETDQPVGARGAVIGNLSTFISLTDDKLLVQKAVHNPILELLRWYGGNEAEDGSSPGPSYDESFVDLLYAICSKIRGDPMLLNIFFQDRKWLKSVEQRSFSSDSIAAMMRSIESLRSEGGSATSGFEFLLFSHLLRFVHRDGEVGDTARTSLLFLLELATTEIMASTGGSTALEMFILEDSGFAAILSATLGAMYSQLPRSLRVTTGPAAVIPESFPSYSADLQNAIESSIFSANDQHNMADRWPEDRAPASSSSPEFRACLGSFAGLLAFIQDVLFRCPSAQVCVQLLNNLRNNFLQTILYPSLLESSDTDGSSVAVMRYLETMLHVTRHEDLASTIMDFLTDEGSASSSASPSPPPPSEQQMSIDNLPETNVLLPFTLRDLVYTNLQSTVSMDAVVTALNLLRLVLSKHCRYSSRLIETERVQPSGLANGWMTNCTVAIDVHRQELEMYARLMTQLQGDVEKKETDGPQMLHIPWRRNAGPQPGERARLEARMLMPESFTTGYDEYLEDAAQDWDAHQAYHSELDALFAAQAARDEAALNERSASLPKTARGVPALALSPGKQRRMRPRKYSEAVMAPEAAKREPRASAPTQPKPSRACAVKHVRYHVKPSDPIVRALMALLTKHFAQPRECNLALTGVLSALVGCPYRTLDLWLGFNLPALLTGVLSKPWALWMDNLRNISGENSADDSDSEGEIEPPTHKRQLSVGGAPATAIAAASAEKYAGLDRELQSAVRTLPSGATSPSLYRVLGGLVQQATVLRNEIPDFARRLKRARNALMGVVEDVADLDEELECSSNASDARGGARDRGLSSASLENARSISGISQPPSETVVSRVPDTGSRSRSTSVSTAHRNRRPKDADTRSASDAQRMRSNSAAHTSEAASTASTTNQKSTALSASSAEVASPASSWHALNVPPANANLAEFLENVIILQESIKEIIARVQVRRENGGDENAVV